MTETKVECNECHALVLPKIAAANGGLCAQCVKIPEKLRQERREYDKALSQGLLFVPSKNELESTQTPIERAQNNVSWELEPEFYKQQLSVMQVLKHAKSEALGHIFLISSLGSRLNVAFNGLYGVCEYQNEENGFFCYAYTADNLNSQVGDNAHLVQACPCCGVGMLWYPTRFHLPRSIAFEIVERVTGNDWPPYVKWLEYDDISYTEPGRG
ncbi:MAG: hypothetical protein C5B53_01100 [Candidatus Melainabacteria bacterium]|nr:MAG: hypothetical protein C5B53_01100 [Candidatus Melainabacteria bacterium]